MEEKSMHIVKERNGIIMSKNDDTIIALKKKIEQIKESLEAPSRFQPQTTCMITIDGERININTINNVKNLNYIIIKLNMFALAAADLNISIDEFEIDGFTYNQWFEDLMHKKAILEYNAKIKELNTQEKKLEKLLSEDKKTELELEEIAKLLG